MDKELQEAFDAFKAGAHTAGQFQMLMDALPLDTREEMDRRAAEILGIDSNKPAAYSNDGEPLYRLDPEEYASRNGMTTDEAQQSLDAFMEDYRRRGGEIPKPDPHISMLKAGPRPDGPLFVETEQKDENGEPVVYVSQEGAGVLIIEMALSHNTGDDPNPKSIEIFNGWMSLARQRGVSQIIIDRLRDATKSRKGKDRVLRDVIRCTKKVGIFEVFQAMAGGTQ
ncbi:hypothetical protein SAMN02949497_1194 [Methylomagnum ishizawai]|uniref:Uncharacterized protein n=1 Tax=Methylomagnum ishizawai TaxID=1760988 RepID=A0A1Y6CTF7_9GAMM|nr:hypothetical protein [Methylomagnum ishizawai]SMF93898.1 hypothetical protein SAMN02949497_1194 [Methylomagnum ishizawai]